MARDRHPGRGGPGVALRGAHRLHAFLPGGRAQHLVQAAHRSRQRGVQDLGQRAAVEVGAQGVLAVVELERHG